MFCPQCRSEYRAGFTRCADCDVALVESLDDAWADGGAPLDDALEPLHETRSSDELGELLERLEDERVPYLIQAGTALALLDGHDLAEAAQPDHWEARVAVSAPLLRRAREILGELQRARATGVRVERSVPQIKPE